MKRVVHCALVLAVAAAATTARAQEQRRGPRGGGFGLDLLGLLSQKSVQEELKLSEDQAKKVTELAEKQRGASRPSRDASREERQKQREERAKANDKAVAEILKPEQVKRLKQISLQRRGARAFGDAEVADALKLTDEQTDKIKAIQEDVGKELGDLRRGGDREEARKKAETLRKAAGEKAMNLLTAEQKTKWKELTGEPFKGEIRFPGPGGRGRSGNGARRSDKP
jgi:Spy/CpxP family protein refolding chaperone